MNPISIIAPLVLVIIGSIIGSIKIVNEGNEALVERLGRYRGKLKAGLNFTIPLIETIVVEESTRERVLQVQPQQIITRDSVSVKADAVISWEIADLEKAYYNVENIEEALESILVTTLATTIGQLGLKEINYSRIKINKSLLDQLEQPTADWGVKINRVEAREIIPAQAVLESLELERAAESKKQAEILEAEGTVKSLEMLTKALQSQPVSADVLRYLLAQRFVDANQQLSASPNSKILFMDPKSLNETISALMDNSTQTPPTPPPPTNPGSGTP